MRKVKILESLIGISKRPDRCLVLRNRGYNNYYQLQVEDCTPIIKAITEPYCDNWEQKIRVFEYTNSDRFQIQNKSVMFSSCRIDYRRQPFGKVEIYVPRWYPFITWNIFEGDHLIYTTNIDKIDFLQHLHIRKQDYRLGGSITRRFDI